MRVHIEFEGAEPGDRLGLGCGTILRAPQHRPNARQQFSRVERFGDVVVGADLEPDDSIDVFALR